eukprot:364297-Chlamydomonas_euryale.AAC.1
MKASGLATAQASLAWLLGRLRTRCTCTTRAPAWRGGSWTPSCCVRRASTWAWQSWSAEARWCVMPWAWVWEYVRVGVDVGVCSAHGAHMRLFRTTVACTHGLAVACPDLLCPCVRLCVFIVHALAGLAITRSSAHDYAHGHCHCCSGRLAFPDAITFNLLPPKHNHCKKHH